LIDGILRAGEELKYFRGQMIRMNYQTKYLKDNENKSKVESQSQKINNTIVISTLLLNSSLLHNTTT
jgi:hypothetical protein